jgi:hypothetical protein
MTLKKSKVPPMLVDPGQLLVLQLLTLCKLAPELARSVDISEIMVEFRKNIVLAAATEDRPTSELDFILEISKYVGDVIQEIKDAKENS